MRNRVALDCLALPSHQRGFPFVARDVRTMGVLLYAAKFDLLFLNGLHYVQRQFIVANDINYLRPKVRCHLQVLEMLNGSA